MSQKLEVLIIDDETDIREMLVRQFAALGFSATEASNGEVALVEVSKKKFDLIITDLAMPRMNGFEFLRKLKMNQNTIPVIVLTGHADRMVAKQLQSFGIKEFIDKPWFIEDLEKSLQEIFPHLKKTS